MEKKKIVPDVMAFLNKCSEIIGRFENESFNQDSWCFVQENDVDSPIEQILYFSFETLRRLNYFKKEEPFDLPKGSIFIGMDLKPQVSIGKYRVDFLASYSSEPNPYDFSQNITCVVVECDSQEFHDRSEKERRYEKARDRFLQMQGYKIFHFTGKEIKDRPFIVAAEIIAYLVDQKVEDILDPNYIE